MADFVRKFTDDDLKALWDKGIRSQVDMARELGVNPTSVMRRRRKLARLGWSPEHDLTHQVPDGFKVKGVSTYYGADGKPRGQWVKSKEDAERQLVMLKQTIKSLSKDLPQYVPQTRYNEHETDDNMLVVLPIGDLHVGMLSWKDETGNNWNLKKTQLAVYHAFKRVIDSCPTAKRCVIINLGDWFHADNMAGTTTKSGNILDTDSRYPRMVDVGVTLMRQIITFALMKFEEVEVINVTGNHDTCATVCLSILLKHVYENEPRVTIQEKATPVHYVQWGKVMLATTHGDTIKMNQLAGVSAQDQAKMWGNTEFRYGLTGHIHNDSRIGQEGTGMHIRSFRTLAPNDAYAAWYGWRSGRDTRAIVYHKDHGQQQEYIVGISMIKEFLEDE